MSEIFYRKNYTKKQKLIASAIDEMWITIDHMSAVLLAEKKECPTDKAIVPIVFENYIFKKLNLN